MTSKKHDLIELDRSQYLNYQKKAQDFYKAMLQAEKSEYWNAVGLNAVHCAISISDALLVKFRGIRSLSKNHMVVVDILKQNLNLRDINSKISTLKRILAKKSLIEYDSAIFTKSDEQDIMKQSERFYLWAREELT